MHPTTCPCCYTEETYDRVSGYCESDGQQIEPDEGYCSHCGFHWSQHVQHPEREQVLKHRETLKTSGFGLDWNDLTETDKLFGYHD